MTFEPELESIEGNITQNFETQFLELNNKLTILSSIQDLQEWERCQEDLNSEVGSSSMESLTRKSEGTNGIAKEEATTAGITSKIVGKDDNYVSSWILLSTRMRLMMYLRSQILRRKTMFAW